MAGVGEIAAAVGVELILFGVGVGVLLRVWAAFLPFPKRHVVLPYQRGVISRNGTTEKIVGPGSYWITPKTTLMVCDVRPTPFQVPAQVLATIDGMGVRISMGGEYHVTDAALFLSGSTDAFGTFYLEIRQALLQAVHELQSDRFPEDHLQIARRVEELVLPRGSHLGIQLTKLAIWEAVPVGWLSRNE